MKIRAWTIMTCGTCGHSRTHYKTFKKNEWHCITTLPGWTGPRHGQPSRLYE